MTLSYIPTIVFYFKYNLNANIYIGEIEVKVYGNTYNISTSRYASHRLFCRA